MFISYTPLLSAVRWRRRSECILESLPSDHWVEIKLIVYLSHNYHSWQSGWMIAVVHFAPVFECMKIKLQVLLHVNRLKAIGLLLYAGKPSLFRIRTCSHISKPVFPQKKMMNYSIINRVSKANVIITSNCLVNLIFFNWKRRQISSSIQLVKFALFGT